MKGKRDNSYRSIFRGTSVFGGVQLFQILANLVRGKFVAMFLGPQGMGVSSLFTSTSTAITQFSSLGLTLAATKEVAEHQEDNEKLSAVISTATWLINLCACMGALFCIVAASWLSRITFGTGDYSWEFVLLSLCIWLSVASSGRMAVLQGLQRVKALTQASVAGALVGLFAGVPLYYFFGVHGIVPAMILLALSNWLFSGWHLRKVLPGGSVRRTWQERRPMVRNLLALGLTLVITILIGALCNYLLNVFLRIFGNLDDIGLYNAANSITNQYAGVVFAAMSLDYFPRLSSISNDTEEMNRVINRQSEIVSLIAAPMAILIIAAAPLVISLLLTAEFSSITPLLRLMALGVLFKALAFPMGYISFAKNNRRIYIWLEGITCNVIYLGFAVAGYLLFGLIGLGYAMAAEFLMNIVIYYAVNRRVYGYQFSRAALGQYLIAGMLTGGAYAASLIPGALLSQSLMIAIFILSASFTFLRLRTLLKR